MATNSFGLLVGSLLVGSHLLEFLGITFLFCIGIQIVWNGCMTLAKSLG